MDKVREPYFNAAETNEHRHTFYIEHSSVLTTASRLNLPYSHIIKTQVTVNS